MMKVLESFSLSGKNALITGASGGIGHHLVYALLEAGAEVVMSGASTSIFDFEKELASEGYNAKAFQADLGSYEGVKNLFDKAVEYFNGRIDILVNGAGTQFRCPAVEYPLNEWDRILSTNLDSAFYMSQLAGKLMLEAGKGSIINICSISTVFGGRQIPAYTASKCGMQGMTRSLSNEWCGRGVRVNAIAPGYMETKLTATMRSIGDQVAQVTARIPMGHWGTGEELKGALVYLASDASAYVSGSTLTVDGGYCCS